MSLADAYGAQLRTTHGLVLSRFLLRWGTSAQNPGGRASYQGTDQLRDDDTFPAGKRKELTLGFHLHDANDFS